MLRDKPVARPAKGTRKCNCRNKVVTRQLGPGMFQQFQQQECQECPNVAYARETEALSVAVEPGMSDRQARRCSWGRWFRGQGACGRACVWGCQSLSRAGCRRLHMP